mmetsp:Transcript_20741/g.46935  ORF Transcript_20741/g.46935 Transcript_20741/m.46935 type:complete len:329 (-) Transcript_20741:63-1049(-)
MGEDTETKKKRRKRSRKGADLKTAVTTADEINGDGDVVEDPTQLDESVKPKEAEAANATNDIIDNGEGDDATKKKRKRKRKRKAKSPIEEENPDESSNSDDVAKLQSVDHTVFVEGLPFSASEDDVRSFFAQNGCDDILQIRLPRWQDTGRLRGFGHVVFASTETRSRALSDEVNGKNLGSRYVTVKEANAPRAGTTAGASLGGKARQQPKGCKTVYIRNLPFDATEDQILEVFRTCGKVVEGGIRIARNHVTGQSKGFCYCEFKNEEAAYSAVQRAAKPFGVTVLKRPVFVDYDEGAMKGSYRSGDGKLWSKEYGDRQQQAGRKSKR